jgi:hypothetical protein
MIPANLWPHGGRKTKYSQTEATAGMEQQT